MAERNAPHGSHGALALISASPGISQSEITAATGINQSKVVGIIDFLESSGFVIRAKSDADRRRASLRTTAAGERELLMSISVMEAVENKMLALMSENERNTFNLLLDRMKDSIEASASGSVSLRRNLPGIAAVLRARSPS
jgi:DNA-binding MarR family transcriptional regulator